MNIKDQVIDKISSFPTLPTMASKLLNLLDDPHISGAQISQIIQYDPALTANLMKAANSAYWGHSRQVSSISEAFFRLGTKWIFQMSVSSLIYSNLRKPVTGYDLSAEDLWHHSIAVALMSDILCKHLNLKEIGLIFTSGLLHDMGKIILGEFVSDSFEEIRTIVDEEKISFEAAERKILGIDHAEVGGMIAESWQFPEAMVAGIRWHHNPDSAEEQSQIIDLIHMADAICLMQGIGIGKDNIHYHLNDSSVRRLKITNQILESATCQLASALEEVDNIINDIPVVTAQ
jgi:putative nucleotidyltransferase with HDIG domain